MIGRRLLALAMVASALAGACNTRGMAYGDPNSIIAVMSPDLWDQVSDTVYAQLERTIVTVRDEKTFTVTYQEPYGDHWDNLRRFEQMLLVGTLSDRWMQDAIKRSDQPITEPGTYQVQDVWSNGQVVTLVVLSHAGAADELAAALPDVYSRLNKLYLAYARNRMYMSGVDSALADTLSTQYGFSVLVPEVYTWRKDDSTFVFRNDQPDPSELIREISVSWKTPAPAHLSTDDILAWRAQVVTTHYTEPQDTMLEGMAVTDTTFDGHPGVQIQAQWRNLPTSSWPAAGPFITRVVTCDDQDRTYLVDAWLYAPGKEKYEYMIQLETILDTFRCG
jgi:Domain of unknown function (DUF4837)